MTLKGPGKNSHFTTVVIVEEEQKPLNDGFGTQSVAWFSENLLLYSTPCNMTLGFPNLIKFYELKPEIKVLFMLIYFQ